ncbi:hypothetical protein Tco_1434594, partial [Tanacetum coccineum]
MALLPHEQRHRFLRYEGLEYLDTDIADFEGRLARIHRREVNRVPVFDFGGFPDLMARGLSGRMLMEHRNEAGVSVFTNRSWRRMLDIRGPLVHELILEFFSTFRFGQAILDLDTLGTLQFQLGGARRHPILRLCHRLIACSIAGRSQAPEKVTVMDLFYLRGMDVGSVNVPYLLARYLRLFAAWRKSGAYIFGGQFVARLAEHFGLLTAEILGGLTVIAPELPIIDMTELVRLQICTSLATSTTTSSRQDHASKDVQIRGGRARDKPGIDKAARGPQEGNIDKYWWRIYESGNLKVLES